MDSENKPALAAAAQKALSRLAQNCPGLKWATVATKDGAEVASHGVGADEKLSVMTGTMHALADGIVGEAELGTCHDIILAADRGRIVILGLRGAASEPPRSRSGFAPPAGGPALKPFLAGTRGHRRAPPPPCIGRLAPFQA